MILVGHETNLGRQIYNGRHAYLTKGYNLRSLQSAMELLQIAIAQFITKCDGQLLQIGTAFLLQSATWFITNCDKYYKVRWIYYKLRQVLQSAMIITNCDSTKPPSRLGRLHFLSLIILVGGDTSL